MNKVLSDLYGALKIEEDRLRKAEDIVEVCESRVSSTKNYILEQERLINIRNEDAK